MAAIFQAGTETLFALGKDLSGQIRDTAELLQAHVVTLVVSRLAIQIATVKIVGRAIPENVSMSADMMLGPWPASTIQIWPPYAYELYWPPRLPFLDNADPTLDSFMNRWRSS